MLHQLILSSKAIKKQIFLRIEIDFIFSNRVIKTILKLKAINILYLNKTI